MGGAQCFAPALHRFVLNPAVRWEHPTVTLPWPVCLPGVAFDHPAAETDFARFLATGRERAVVLAAALLVGVTAASAAIFQRWVYYVAAALLLAGTLFLLALLFFEPSAPTAHSGSGLGRLYGPLARLAHVREVTSTAIAVCGSVFLASALFFLDDDTCAAGDDRLGTTFACSPAPGPALAFGLVLIGRLFSLRLRLVLPLALFALFVFALAEVIFGGRRERWEFAVALIAQAAGAVGVLLEAGAVEAEMRLHFQSLVEFERARRQIVAGTAKVSKVVEAAVPPLLLTRLRGFDSVLAGGVLEDSAAAATVGIVGVHNFAQWSTGVLPHDVVAALHGLFTAFDGGIRRFGATRAATYGDQYVVCAGLQDDQVLLRTERGPQPRGSQSDSGSVSMSSHTAQRVIGRRETSVSLHMCDGHHASGRQALHVSRGASIASVPRTVATASNAGNLLESSLGSDVSVSTAATEHSFGKQTPLRRALYMTKAVEWMVAQEAAGMERPPALCGSVATGELSGGLAGVSSLRYVVCGPCFDRARELLAKCPPRRVLLDDATHQAHLKHLKRQQTRRQRERGRGPSSVMSQGDLEGSHSTASLSGLSSASSSSSSNPLAARHAVVASKPGHPKEEARSEAADAVLVDLPPFAVDRRLEAVEEALLAATHYSALSLEFDNPSVEAAAQQHLAAVEDRRSPAAFLMPLPVAAGLLAAVLLEALLDEGEAFSAVWPAVFLLVVACLASAARVVAWVWLEGFPRNVVLTAFGSVATLAVVAVCGAWRDLLVVRHAATVAVLLSHAEVVHVLPWYARVALRVALVNVPLAVLDIVHIGPQSLYLAVPVAAVPFVVQYQLEATKRRHFMTTRYASEAGHASQAHSEMLHKLLASLIPAPLLADTLDTTDRVRSARRPHRALGSSLLSGSYDGYHFGRGRGALMAGNDSRHSSLLSDATFSIAALRDKTTERIAHECVLLHVRVSVEHGTPPFQQLVRLWAAVGTVVERYGDERLHLLDSVGDEFVIAGPFDDVPHTVVEHTARRCLDVVRRLAKVVAVPFTAVLCSGTVRSALLVGRRMSCTAFGPAVRESTALLEAAPTAVVPVCFATSGFRRVAAGIQAWELTDAIEAASAGLEHVSQDDDSVATVFGPGALWRVQGAGQVLMHTVRLRARLAPPKQRGLIGLVRPQHHGAPPRGAPSIPGSRHSTASTFRWGPHGSPPNASVASSLLRKGSTSSAPLTHEKGDPRAPPQAPPDTQEPQEPLPAAPLVQHFE